MLLYHPPPLPFVECLLLGVGAYPYHTLFLVWYLLLYEVTVSNKQSSVEL